MSNRAPVLIDNVKTDEKPEPLPWASFSFWKIDPRKHNERRYINLRLYVSGAKRALSDGSGKTKVPT